MCVFVCDNQSFVYVIRPVKINHVSAKNLLIFSSLLYHNLLTIYANNIKSLLLPQNLMVFLHTTFRAEDISENITWCILHSHG